MVWKLNFEWYGNTNCCSCTWRKSRKTSNKLQRAPANTKFKINDAKLYVPTVTVSIQDDNKILDELKAEF